MLTTRTDNSKINCRESHERKRTQTRNKYPLYRNIELASLIDSENSLKESNRYTALNIICFSNYTFFKLALK